MDTYKPSIRDRVGAKSRRQKGHRPYKFRINLPVGRLIVLERLIYFILYICITDVLNDFNSPEIHQSP